MPPRKRLGQLLTELGVIDEHQLQSALGHQKQWGGKLGSVLVQKGFCKEPDVVNALSKHLGMPQVKLTDAKIDPRAVKFVSRQIAEKLHVFPYELSGTGRGEVVTVAMSDPTDLSAVDQLAFHTGKRIKPMLAGDTEIVQMIQIHYTDEKRATTGELKAVAPLRGATGEMKPVTAQRATTSELKPLTTPAVVAPVAPPPAVSNQFPRRIGPETTPAGGSPRVAPYIPPPIPAAAPKPEQKLEEIEPDASMVPPTPVDLPEDDGEAMPLEPIAAHSQFGEEVSGQEEVIGEGSAADVVEGLESASVKHDGIEEASQMEGLEPIAAHSQPAEPEGGWGAEAAPAAEGWGAEPAAEAPLWADDTPAAEVEEAPQEWGSSDAGWGAASEAPAPAEGGEQLPMDAIIGTAETQETAGWGTDEQLPAPEETPAAEERPSSTEEFAAPPHEAVADVAQALEAASQPEEAAAESAPAESAEAPDAWGASDDPLASTTETPPPEWGEIPSQDESAPSEDGYEARPRTDKFAQEAAAESVTAGSEAPDETEAPPEWGHEAPSVEESAAPAEETAEHAGEFAFAPEEQAAAPEEEAAPPGEEAAPPGEEAAPPGEEAAPPEEEAAPPEEEAAPPAEEAAAPEEEQPPPSEEFTEQGEIELAGWVAPPPEPEPQGAGWLGEALEATTPLSAADHGTLASVGVDPNDGVGALRLLAAIVRVLSRRQALDFDEIAAEVNESRSQAAAEYAAAQAANGEPQAESSETEQAPVEPAET